MWMPFSNGRSAHEKVAGKPFSGVRWDDVIDRIGRARCVAVGQRGWGESIATDERYDLAAMADDVQGVVAALGLERYVLVGHSMGGKVAQIVAVRRPASLLGLVLVAPAPPTPMPVPEAQRGAMLASYGSREGVQQALMVLAGSPLSNVAREQVIEDTLRGAPGAKREWAERGTIEDISAGLEAVTVPTIVVVGDRDRVEHESALRQAFGHFLPHATFRVLAGVGHLSPLERPGELAAACLDMLATVSAPDGEPDRTRAT
jgi:pimeloyl-ACP methyl ester carboxylesterase